MASQESRPDNELGEPELKKDNESISEPVVMAKVNASPEFKAPCSLPSKTSKEPGIKNQTTESPEPESKRPSKFDMVQPGLPNQAQALLSYIEPSWSGACTASYSFDILKCGKIIGTVPLTGKKFVMFGRLKDNDISMDHPSISRYHAVVQFCAESTPIKEAGWYLYDLGSTHGSCANKMKVPPRIYRRIKVGHMIKLGGSSRLYILQVSNFMNGG